MNTGMPKTHTTLTEQDILADMLTQEKQLISSYSTLICETSCQNMRKVLQQNMTESMEDQYCIFDQMRTKGYYPTEDAPTPKVEKAKQKLGQIKSSLQ